MQGHAGGGQQGLHSGSRPAAPNPFLLFIFFLCLLRICYYGFASLLFGRFIDQLKYNL